MIGPIWVSGGLILTSVILKDIGTYRAGPSSAPQAGHGLISVCHIARYCVVFWLCSAPLSVALVAIREIEYEAIPADMHRDILFSILDDIRRYQHVTTRLVYRIELAASRQNLIPCRLTSTPCRCGTWSKGRTMSPGIRMRRGSCTFRSSVH